MDSTLELLIPIIAIILVHSVVFGISYIYLRNRNRERMLMIEKGVDPSLFIKKPNTFIAVALKYGFLLAGLGLGFLAGNLLDTYTPLHQTPSYFGMILLFGGGGLLAYYFLQKKNDKAGN
jgi:hypothetical protein